MTFPTANSSIIYNEDGEPMGWDAAPEPDYSPEDFLANADYYSDDEEDFWGNLEECKRQDWHGVDCSKEKHGGWTCDTCGEPCPAPEEDEEMDDQEIAEGRLRSYDYEAWANL